MEKAVAKESMIHETGQEVLFGLNYSDCNSPETDEAAVNHDCKKKKKSCLSIVKPCHQNKMLAFYIPANHRYVKFACFINATPTFLQNLSSHIQITCMLAVWDGGYVTARRDSGQVKLDIFNEMSWQCPAVWVATEPGKPKHDFFPNPNQTISAALSQHPSVLLSRVRFCRRRRIFKTSLSPAMLFELLLRDQGIPSADKICNPPSEFWVCPRVFYDWAQPEYGRISFQLLISMI